MNDYKQGIILFWSFNRFRGMFNIYFWGWSCNTFTIPLPLLKEIVFIYDWYIFNFILSILAYLAYRQAPHFCTLITQIKTS